MQCTELQALADRCARDRQTAEREVERLMESASKEHGSLNDQVEAIVDRMKEVESERDSAVLALREARADAAESERRWAAKLEADREDQDTARRVRAAVVSCRLACCVQLSQPCGDVQVQEDLTNELDDMRLKLRNAQASVKDLTAQVQDMDAKLAKVLQLAVYGSCSSCMRFSLCVVATTSIFRSELACKADLMLSPRRNGTERSSLTCVPYSGAWECMSTLTR